jgi:hypothetical protein
MIPGKYVGGLHISDRGEAQTIALLLEHILAERTDQAP